MRRCRRTAVAALASLWICGAALPAAAQLPDLLDVSGQYMPGVALEDPRPAYAQVSSYDGVVNVPVALGERDFLIPGLAYHVEAVSFSQVPAQFVDVRQLHSLEVPLLFVHLLPKGWSLSLRVAPGLAGDFKGFDRDMLRLSAVALATHAFSDQLVVGGGAIASYAFGTLLPLPAAYVDWSPTRFFRIETFVPAFLNAKFTLWGRVEIGGRAEIAGNSYAIRDTRIRNEWPCVARAEGEAGPGTPALAPVAAECFDHLAYSVASAGAVIGVRLVSSVWLTAFGGHSLYRRFEQMNESDDRIPGGAQDLPNAYFVRTGLTWRIPRED